MPCTIAAKLLRAGLAVRHLPKVLHQVIRVRSEIDLIVLKIMQPSQPRLRNQLVPRQPDLLPLPNQGGPARHLPSITNAHRQHMSSHTRPAVTTTEQLHTSQRMASTHAPLQHVRAQQRGTILRDHAPSFGSRSQAICMYKPPRQRTSLNRTDGWHQHAAGQCWHTASIQCHCRIHLLTLSLFFQSDKKVKAYQHAPLSTAMQVQTTATDPAQWC